MDKILEMLGVQKLDESAQAEIKDKLQSIIEVKASEITESKLTEEKERLIEEYENKFEEYKDEITSKFSNFVDSVLDEEMSIPERILEFARKGELYTDLIEQFKIRLSVDEGLLDEEVKGLLKEAKAEIQSLREEVDKSTESVLDLQLENQKLTAENHLRKKCDGLTEGQKSHVMDILGDSTDIDEIDRKFSLVIESIDLKEEIDKKKEKEEEEEKEEKEAGEEGKGISVIKEKTEEHLVSENSGPFADYLKGYVRTLKEGKI